MSNSAFTIGLSGTANAAESGAKAWAYYDTGAGLNASFNVTSSTDGGANIHTITWTTAFSSSSYCCIACPQAEAADTAASSWSAQISNNTFTASTAKIFTTNSNGNYSVGEVNHTFVAAWGNQ